MNYPLKFLDILLVLLLFITALLGTYFGVRSLAVDNTLKLNTNVTIPLNNTVRVQCQDGQPTSFILTSIVYDSDHNVLIIR